MFLMQTIRIMAGPYLCQLMDNYYANQDILNSIVVICATIWIFYQRYFKNSPAAK